MKRIVVCGILSVGLLTGCDQEPKTDTDVLIDLGVPKKIAEVVSPDISEIKENDNVYTVLIDSTFDEENLPKIKEALSNLPPSDSEGENVIEFISLNTGESYAITRLKSKK